MSGPDTIDRFAYSSVRRGDDVAYRVVARSSGVTPEEAAEAGGVFSLLGNYTAVPGHARYPEADFVFVFECSRRLCRGVVTDAGRDPLGRPARLAATAYVMAPETFGRFGRLPIGCEPACLDPDRVPPELPALAATQVLAQGAAPGAIEEAARVLAAAPAGAVAALLVAAERRKPVALVTEGAEGLPRRAMSAVMQLLPPSERRLTYATAVFAWGEDLFRHFVWVAAPIELLDLSPPPRGVRVIRWSADQEVGERASPYAREVARLIREHDVAALTQLMRDLERLHPLPSPAQTPGYFAYLRVRSCVDGGGAPRSAALIDALDGLLRFAGSRTVARLVRASLVSVALAEGPGRLADVQRALRVALGRAPGPAAAAAVEEGLAAALGALADDARWLPGLLLLQELQAAAPALLEQLARRAAAHSGEELVALAEGVLALRVAHAAPAWRASAGEALEILLVATQERGGARLEGVVRAYAGQLDARAPAEDLDRALRWLERTGQFEDAARLLLARRAVLPDARAHALRLLTRLPLDAGAFDRLARLAFARQRPDALASQLVAWARAERVDAARLARVLLALESPAATGVILAAPDEVLARALAAQLAAFDAPSLASALALAGPALVERGSGALLPELLPPAGLPGLGAAERHVLGRVEEQSFARWLRDVEERTREEARDLAQAQQRAAEALQAELEAQRGRLAREHALRRAALEAQLGRELAQQDDLSRRRGEQQARDAAAGRARHEDTVAVRLREVEACRARWRQLTAPEPARAGAAVPGAGPRCAVGRGRVYLARVLALACATAFAAAFALRLAGAARWPQPGSPPAPVRAGAGGPVW